MLQNGGFQVMLTLPNIRCITNKTMSIFLGRHMYTLSQRHIRKPAVVSFLLNEGSKRFSQICRVPCSFLYTSSFAGEWREQGIRTTMLQAYINI